MVAHSTIAAALGRRSFIEVNRKAMFMNLYAGIVAKPGSGKTQVMELALEVIKRTNDYKNGTLIRLGNDSVSKASLLTDMMEARRELPLIIGGNNKMITLHEMTCFHDELQVFMPMPEPDKVGLLLKLYDCPGHYKETRITAKTPREMDNVYFNWLFGTNPDFWTTILGIQQDTGIKSRIVLCSDDVDPTSRDFFRPTQGREIQEILTGGNIDEEMQDWIDGLARDLACINVQFYGSFRMESAVPVLLNGWWRDGGKPLPQWLALGDYPVRRPMHVIKLAGHKAASRGSKLITLADANYALETLFDWEDSTKYIQYDLRQSQHGRIMDETYGFFYSKTVVGDTIKQFSGQDLRKYLSTKVRVYEIEPMITQMIQAGYIVLKGDLTQEPKPGQQGILRVQRFAVNPKFKMKDTWK